MSSKFTNKRFLTSVPDELGPSEPLYPPKLRPCRSCKKPNPNYFHCHECLEAKERKAVARYRDNSLEEDDFEEAI